MRRRILIVDDEPNITLSFSSLLKDEGYQTETAATVIDARARLEQLDFALVLLDLNLPDDSGIALLKNIGSAPGAPLVLVISGQSEISTALEAVRLGAIDYLEKPVSPEKLISSVRSAFMLIEANRQRNILVEELDRTSSIVGESPVIVRLLENISRIALSDATVLILGANGTGKELVATRLYLQSNRRNNPFVKVNCPGIPETLFESELFGHTKGSFTGAVKDYPGKFVLADQGTIFLDEIGDLPLECQAKLLRVLETGEVETLGSVKPKQVEVRVICATNRDLNRLVAERKFREDLFYRISVLPITVPPLAERRPDIPLLVGEFLRRYDPSGKTALTTDAIAYLSTLAYPGNVRQLKNLIERITILHAGQKVGVAEIAPQFTQAVVDSRMTPSMSLTESLSCFERELIRSALAESGGNISKAASQLKTERANLSKKIKDLGLKAE